MARRTLPSLSVGSLAKEKEGSSLRLLQLPR